MTVRATAVGDLAGATRLEFGLLGPLTATLDGRDLNLGGPRQRAVIAALLLARGQPVDTVRLLDMLWGAKQPKDGPGSLQAFVSNLRRALEPGRTARAPSTVLTSTASGYAMPVPEESVDVWRFERLVSDETDPARRIVTLRTALSLWRGGALSDYAGQEWADADARRLEELRAVATEQLIAARMDVGESAVVVPEIETLLTADPLREERWRLLALALYRSHRQGDSLAALRRARTVLADELGVDPGPALRALEADVLAQSPVLDAPSVAIRPVQAHPPADRSKSRVKSSARDLVDRDDELAEMRRSLEAAADGRPGLVLVEGTAGIGKTSLLEAIRREARSAGLLVLTARGSQLEKEFGFGAVRQLFDPLLDDQSKRETLLAGAGAGAGTVFDATQTADGSQQAETLFAVLRGLYGMTANLAHQQPVVLTVDDVQWCDTGSLRFLAYLAGRLGSMRLLVAATLRTGEQYADDDLLEELTGQNDVVEIRPRPLSLHGTRALLETRLAGADDEFAQACFGTTSGNPLLLRQLVRALEAEHVRPDALHVDTVRAIGARAVSSMVLMRFKRMPPANRAVARAIAVLGDGASLPMVAAMADLSDAEVAAAIAALARSEVLRPDHPLGFVHALVASAVLDDLPLGERDLLHERAARILMSVGASAEQIAAHLLLVPPRGDAKVVGVLREAARLDERRGSIESAMGYLQRALAEPPASSDYPALLLQLGPLEAMNNRPEALKHLQSAYELSDEPAAKAEAAIVLARTAIFVGARGEAATLAAAAAAVLPDTLVDQRQALDALERITVSMHSLDPTSLERRAVPEVVGTGFGARLLAAGLAWEEMYRGEDREHAMALADFALQDRMLQQTDTGMLWVHAAATLQLADRDNTTFWEAENAHAYKTGNLLGVLTTHLFDAHQKWLTGDLDGALTSVGHFDEQRDVWGANRVSEPFAAAIAAGVRLDRGDVLDARRAVDLARGRRGVGDGARLCREAEVRVLLATGDVDGALRLVDLLSDPDSRVVNPVWRPWRSLRALVLAELGRTDEAVGLVTEELRLARRWGAPGLVGATLRVLGELQGSTGVATLCEAVDQLRSSPRRLELARAQTALAEALIGSDVPRARPLLEQAGRLSQQCGARTLHERVANLIRLVDTGSETGQGPDRSRQGAASEPSTGVVGPDQPDSSRVDDSSGGVEMGGLKTRRQLDPPDR